MTDPIKAKSEEIEAGMCTPVRSVTKWTPEQFWEYVAGYTGEFEAGAIRDMMRDRGLMLTPQDAGAVRLGDAVYVNDRSPYANDWRNTDWLKVVSLRIDPDGKRWASVTEGNQRHRGQGAYDAETDGFDADHLSPLPRAERSGGEA